MFKFIFSLFKKRTCKYIKRGGSCSRNNGCTYPHCTKFI